MSEAGVKDDVFCANCSLYCEEGTDKCDCVAMKMERKSYPCIYCGYAMGERTEKSLCKHCRKDNA